MTEVKNTAAGEGEKPVEKPVEKSVETPAAATTTTAEEKKPEKEGEKKQESGFVASAAAAVLPDNVMAMFGGPKPRREEVPDEEDEKPQVKKDGEEEAPESPDVHFEPLVNLEKVEVKSNEEAEEQTFKMRAKLFKFHKDTREWKERGTGDVRLLKHKENGKTRLVMRRDKTYKVCANHYIVPDMKLSPNVSSERSWVWSTSADVSEGEPEAQTLAIRFANSENANLFKEAFIKAQQENEALLK